MKTNRRGFLMLAGATGAGMLHAHPGLAEARDGSTPAGRNEVVLDHAVAVLEDGSSLATPFWRIDSGREGPALLLLAAQHGNEIHGAEVASRWKDVCAATLAAGSAWLVPMANLPAIRARRHSMDLGPEQPGRFSRGHNMQQAWPGDSAGNDTERIAYALDRAVVRHCSHLVDMHCWNQFWAAETLAVLDHAPSQPLAEFAATRFISYRPARPPAEKPSSISHLMHQRGGGAIVIELSGQFQVQERQVLLGLHTMINAAKALGMIEGDPEPPTGPRIERTAQRSREVPAPCSGIFVTAMRKDASTPLIPEDFVEEGQPLGHVIRESDLAAIPVIAPVAGYLWQLNACHGQLCDASLPAQHPYAVEGDRLALIVGV